MTYWIVITVIIALEIGLGVIFPKFMPYVFWIATCTAFANVIWAIVYYIAQKIDEFIHKLF